VCHTGCATASVLSGVSGATRAPSSLQRDESTRAVPPPPGGGKRPLPLCRAEQSSWRGEAGRGAPVLQAGLPGPQGPSGVLLGAAGPAPAPPRPGEEPGNGHPPPPAARATHTAGSLRAVREPRCRGARRTLDRGCRAAASQPAQGSMPPAWRQRLRARRLPGGAAALAPRRAALWLPPPPPQRPRLLLAGLAGGPADSATPSPEPALRSRPAPRPGHARWRLADSEPGRGRCRRGQSGARKGGTPLTAVPGLRASRLFVSGFPFHRSGD
jgi:hypothetical protein